MNIYNLNFAQANRSLAWRLHAESQHEENIFLRANVKLCVRLCKIITQLDTRPFDQSSRTPMGCSLAPCKARSPRQHSANGIRQLTASNSLHEKLGAARQCRVAGAESPLENAPPAGSPNVRHANSSLSLFDLLIKFNDNF